MKDLVQPIKPTQFLGTSLLNPKVIGSKIQEIIDVINNLLFTNSNTTLNFGNGIDGDVTITGTTTLTTTAYYTNLTINSGATLNVNGFKIYHTGTFLNNGTVQGVGANGSPASGTNNSVFGAGGAISNADLNSQGGFAGISSASTGVGAGPNTGINTTVIIEASGALGGVGGSGSSGAGGTMVNVTPNPLISTSKVKYLTQIPTKISGIGGIGGASGGGDGTNKGGAGGGGGASGYAILIFAKNIVNNGIIQSVGGNGGAGGSPTTGNCGGGGGGGGGTPGFIYMVYETLSNTGTIQLVGGSGAAGGIGHGTGTNGTAGGNGTGGEITMINLLTGEIL